MKNHRKIPAPNKAIVNLSGSKVSVEVIFSYSKKLQVVNIETLIYQTVTHCAGLEGDTSNQIPIDHDYKLHFYFFLS